MQRCLGTPGWICRQSCGQRAAPFLSAKTPHKRDINVLGISHGPVLVWKIELTSYLLWLLSSELNNDLLLIHKNCLLLSFFFFKFSLYTQTALKRKGGRRKWQPTPVFLPGKVHGQRSLAGCSPWGYMTEHVCMRVEGDGLLAINWQK